MRSKFILLAVLLGAAFGAAALHAGEFSSRDMFSFANETVWDYGGQKREAEEGKYSRRCFVMTRAALQFWKFARFDAKAPAVGDAELERRVREVCGRDAWKEALPPSGRAVFPGYPDLRSFSGAKADILKRSIGLGWPTYFRVGNFCLLYPPGKGSMGETERRLTASLARGEPQAVWLVNFPSLSINHAVLVYADAGSRKGMARYRAYDPNYTDRTFVLAFDEKRGTFAYPKTFYFPGGDVHARIVYSGVFE